MKWQMAGIVESTAIRPMHVRLAAVSGCAWVTAVCIRAASAMLILALLEGCATTHKPHPVQPTPADWKFRARFERSGCTIGETLPIPLEVGGPMRTVTIMDCPTGVKAVDHFTGEDVTPR